MSHVLSLLLNLFLDHLILLLQLILEVFVFKDILLLLNQLSVINLWKIHELLHGAPVLGPPVGFLLENPPLLSLSLGLLYNFELLLAN